jgi:phosphopantetheine--protein transferase-like protein
VIGAYSDHPALGPREVHVWETDLDAAGAASSLLAPDELRRAARLRRDGDRRHFVAARAALRGLLGRYLDEDPRRVELSYGRWGKPAVGMATDLRFNLSHSGGLALIAVARGREVGVDIERLDPALRVEALVGVTMTPQERGELWSLPPSGRHRALLARWTVKEACAKAYGAGLRLAPERLGVEVPTDGATWQTVLENGMRLAVQTLEVAPGYVAALAVEGAGAELRTWQWTA